MSEDNYIPEAFGGAEGDAIGQQPQRRRGEENLHRTEK